LDRLLQQVVNTMARHGLAPGIRKGRAIDWLTQFPKPGFQHLSGFRPQRDRTLFTTLTGQLQEGAGTKAHLIALQGDDFGDTSAAVVEGQE
jgi:hypothetical protein